MTTTSAAFRCTVVSPERPLFEGAAEKLVVPGTKGQIGVLRHHAPLIAKLEPGVVRIHRPADEGGEILRMAVGGGFLQVVGEAVTLLVTDAVTAADVDPVAARRELDAVLESLRHPSSDDDYRALLSRRQSLKAQLTLV